MTTVCGPEPPRATSNTKIDILLDDLAERIKELVNEVRELKDLVEPPDLPPVKVTTLQQKESRP